MFCEVNQKFMLREKDIHTSSDPLSCVFCFFALAGANESCLMKFPSMIFSESNPIAFSRHDKNEFSSI